MLRGNGGLASLLLIAILVAFGISQSNTQVPKTVTPPPQQVLVKPVPAIPKPVQPKPDVMPQPVAAVEIIEVYSEFCAACIKVEPVIKSLQVRGFRVQRINANEDPAKAAQLKIKGTPTIIIYKDGKEIDRIEGYISEPELLLRINNAQLKFFMSPPAATVEKKDTGLAVGANGWRLRVFYPPGEGEGITRLFTETPEFSAFAQNYGYTAFATDDPRFEVWRQAGYPTNKITVVLVNAKDRVVLRTTNVSDKELLMNNLAEAASKPYWMRANLVETN